MGIFRFFARWFSPAPSLPTLPEPFQGTDLSYPEPPKVLSCPVSPPLPITPDLLQQLFPIRNLPFEELNAFATGRIAQAIPAETVLFRASEAAEALYYLLAGQVRMDVGEESYEVTANTPLAKFPLCAGKEQYQATATALTEVQFLRVSRRVISYSTELGHQEESDANPLRSLLYRRDTPGEVRQSRLLQEFCEGFRVDDPCFPAFPDIALKLREAVEQDSGLQEIAHIVEMDPGIAARIVSLANSPLYFAARRVETCRDAVSRLGLVAVRNLVTAISLGKLFRARDAEIIRQLVDAWEQSLYCSALCHQLATRASTVILPEQALLAGLVCDIGVVPFLHFADRLPPEYRQPGELESILPYVRGPLGAFLLEKWGMPEDLARIPSLAEQWLHDAEGALTLADIVTLAKLHQYIGTPRQIHLPRINAIPAYSKLGDGRLSPNHSLRILYDARDRIQEAVRIMSA